MPTLDWIGKNAVIRHHKEVPFRLLEPDVALSHGGAETGNLIVQGDNLHALKALLPKYAGKVKCIYIDPPYNTGNEGWVYNDKVNSPEINRWLGSVVGKEAEDLSRHDKWLCMMYPRMVLLKQFLREDGVIMVSLDDFEITNLRYLMNEIFGSTNFIAQIVWEKGRKNDARFFSTGHEYIVIFARSMATLRDSGISWRQEKEGSREIHQEFLRLRRSYGIDLELLTAGIRKFYKELPKDHPSKKHARYSNVDETGVWRDDNMSWPGGGGPAYDVIHPRTGLPCAVPPGGWRYSTLEKMNEMIQTGKVMFREDHTQPPIRKTYLVREDTDSDDEPLGGEVRGTYFYRSGLPGVNVLRDILGEQGFPNPKDHGVIADLINYVTRYDKDSIILDSFAGSGTTGHAVLKQNAEDGGNRRFILVEMDEKIAEDITAERVRRVAGGYTNAKGEPVQGLGSGFQFCRLSKEPLFNEFGDVRDDVTFAQLADFVWFAETGEGYTGKADSPLLGTHDGVSVYLLFNGILGDRRPAGGNILTQAVLECLPKHDGQRVIYAAAVKGIGPAALARAKIIFKQTPYAIEV
jgi:adenine-specific DNA-methyltransferase